jgi:hypothetical protein
VSQNVSQFLFPETYHTVPRWSRRTVGVWPSKARMVERVEHLHTAGGSGWTEKHLGTGMVLFTPFPLELNDNLQTIGSTAMR